MRRLYIILIAIAAVCAITVATMVFLVPDHRGEIRTDLHVGDYYEISVVKYGTIRHTIIAIDGDSVTDEVTSPYETSTQVVTKESFLKHVHIDPNSSDYEVIGRTIMKTNYGDRVCSVILHEKLLSTYWVDNNGVVFETSVGGTVSYLTETSLIIT